MKTLVTAFFIFLSTLGAAHAKHLPRAIHSSGSSVSYSIPHPSIPWCGWFMRQQVPADPGAAYNLAANWRHYGHPAAGPSRGVIAVWPHHVAMIIGQENGQWVVKEGNWTNKVHIGPRSLQGAVFRSV